MQVKDKIAQYYLLSFKDMMLRIYEKIKKQMSFVFVLS